MQFYSPDKDLKEQLGISIENPSYIKAITTFCKSPEAPFHYDTQFYPHELLVEWSKYVLKSEVGYEDEDDFDRDCRRAILHFIEKNPEFDQFNEHQVLLSTLHKIDNEYKKYCFIPKELNNIEDWWNCCIKRKGTKGYIDMIEEDIFNKYGKRIKVKDSIHLV